MRVIFLCKGNWYRSQMAAAIYNKLTSSEDAYSAGTNVGLGKEKEGMTLKELFPLPDFINLMKEKGFGDLSGNKTKGIRASDIDNYDLVVVMAEEPYIPDYLKDLNNVVYWDIFNPSFVDRKQAEETFNKVYKLVYGLVHGDVA